MSEDEERVMVQLSMVLMGLQCTLVRWTWVAVEHCDLPDLCARVCVLLWLYIARNKGFSIDDHFVVMLDS